MDVANRKSKALYTVLKPLILEPPVRKPLMDGILKFYFWLLLAGVILLMSCGYAFACSKETSEQRVTEALTNDNTFQIITGHELTRFLKNANDLYNIGWVRKEIDKVYVVDAEVKSDNPAFQVEHLFFVNPEGCITYYQTTYRALVDVLLSEKPCEKLGITCAQ